MTLSKEVGAELVIIRNWAGEISEQLRQGRFFDAYDSLGRLMEYVDALRKE